MIFPGFASSETPSPNLCLRHRLQNHTESLLHVIMSKNDTREIVRKNVAALRKRQAAAGFVNVSLPMPREVVAEIDRLKQERGASSRAPILEEAVRFYLEQTRA